MKIVLVIAVLLLSYVSFAWQEPDRQPKNTLVEEDFRAEFLDRINKLRAKGCNCGGTTMPPAEPLTWNVQLQMAALGHAQDMSRNKYFEHKSKNGNTPKDRIFSAGYTINGYRFITIGENIAWGQRSIKEVMEGWLRSENHCKNLMNPQFKEVGIAVNNFYWVQDFGGRERSR
jgi:uncharacterized protein YkwD